MKFVKMHGLGNDFLVVDGVREHLDVGEISSAAPRICDRHFGVGGDGILLALPSAECDFRMVLINADGSEAEHCGNGIRCVARYLYDAGHTRASSFTIETVGRRNTMELQLSAGVVQGVVVDMGEPDLRRGSIPMVGPAADEAIDTPLIVGEAEYLFTCVSMGNPHAVTFVGDVAGFPVAMVGPLVESHAAFPRRTNTEFLQVLSPTELRMRVWERGAGETLACGTGACASVVAAARTGRAGRDVIVHLPGGDLRVEWRTDNHIYMTGPAEAVFHGEVS